MALVVVMDGTRPLRRLGFILIMLDSSHPPMNELFISIVEFDCWIDPVSMPPVYVIIV